MTDRSSPPRKLHRRTPSETAEQITALAPRNTEVCDSEPGFTGQIRIHDLASSVPVDPL